MKLTVRLFATLRENRGKIIEFDDTTFKTVKDVIDHFDISVEEVAILLVNGRDAPLDRVLKNEDVVSIFPPVGGG